MVKTVGFFWKKIPCIHHDFSWILVWCVSIVCPAITILMFTLVVLQSVFWSTRNIYRIFVECSFFATTFSVSMTGFNFDFLDFALDFWWAFTLQTSMLQSVPSPLTLVPDPDLNNLTGILTFCLLIYFIPSLYNVMVIPKLFLNFTYFVFMDSLSE